MSFYTPFLYVCLFRSMKTSFKLNDFLYCGEWIHKISTPVSLSLSTYYSYCQKLANLAGIDCKSNSQMHDHVESRMHVKCRMLLLSHFCSCQFNIHVIGNVCSLNYVICIQVLAHYNVRLWCGPNVRGSK